jgi:hypothetical protein
MRFITMGLWAGEIEDEECEAAEAAGQAHFLSIRDRLPTQLIDLYTNSRLHDGHLVSFHTDAATQIAVLEVDGWNNFNGDYPVFYKLCFGDVTSTSLDYSYPNPIKNRKLAPVGLDDLGYIELDVLSDGLFRIDILFWSGAEIGIVFKSVLVEAIRK